MPGDDVQYPAGTVRELLRGPHVSSATRAALETRIVSRNVSSPRFFDAETFALLSAVVHRLAPEALTFGVNISSMIDERLADGKGNGWRFDIMPSDAVAYALGIKGIDDHARQTFDSAFVALNHARQDLVLCDIQAGHATHGVWAELSPVRFFEELNAEVTEFFYGHPLAQESIGYAGMADLPSWNAIGLDTLEQREPRQIEST